jgi:hypothetical protein
MKEPEILKSHYSISWKAVRFTLIIILAAFSGAGVCDTMATLSVQVEGRSPVIFGPAEFATLPRQTLRARDHRGMELTFGGVLLRELLIRAGAPLGEGLAKADLTNIIQVTGVDGYRVVFSLAELDLGYGAQPVLVADEVAGLRLKPEHGPWRLVVPGDRRHGRWMRQVKRIEVRRLPE